MWFRKKKVDRTSQIHDLQAVWNLLHDTAKLSVLYNVPSAVNKILEGAADVQRYIDQLKRGSK